MRKESDMLFLVMSLLCWSQTKVCLVTCQTWGRGLRVCKFQPRKPGGPTPRILEGKPRAAPWHETPLPPCARSSEGGCSGPIVSISGDEWILSDGDGFKLSCEFVCLTVQHVAQLWRNSPQEESVSLVNVTSILPNVTIALSISSATKADTGYYSCMTQPPDTISSEVLIQVADNLSTSTLTTASNPGCASTKKHNSAASLQGQIWFWILLGKTAILLLSLASLAVKYKSG